MISAGPNRIVHRRPRRRGMVLVLVLIVVTMLALSTYTFTSLMVTENKGAVLAGQQLQARTLVDSGVAHVSLLLELPPTIRQELGGLYENPNLFQAQLVADLGSDRSRARFGVVAPRLGPQGNLGGLRFGLQDESAKLNINALSLGMLAANVSGQGGGRGAGGPGPNSVPGGGTGSGGNTPGGNPGGGPGGGGQGDGGDDDEGGGGDRGPGGNSGDFAGAGPGGGSRSSESQTDDSGGGLNIDTSPRTALMQLPGMTVEIADAILDWIDSDNEPREFGAEMDFYSTLTPPYTPQNGPIKSLEELLLVRGVTPDLLFGRDVNRNGLIDVTELDIPLMIDGDPGDGSMDFGWSAYLTLYSQERNVNRYGEPRIDLNMEDLQQLYDALAEALDPTWASFIVAYRQQGPFRGESENVQPATELELDLTQPGSNRINQVLDLVGARVQVEGEEEEEALVMESPLGGELGSLSTELPKLMDLVTTNPAPAIPGRVNINQAPRAVLLAIPGMTPEIADAIISQRDVQNSEFDESMQHETWILSAGIVTLDEMRVLLPFITAGGDVFRAQIVGYFDGGEVGARADVVFDATTAAPRILSWRDISHLGRGYPREVLGVVLDEPRIP